MHVLATAPAFSAGAGDVRSIAVSAARTVRGARTGSVARHKLVPTLRVALTGVAAVGRAALAGLSVRAEPVATAPADLGVVAGEPALGRRALGSPRGLPRSLRVSASE